MEVGEGSLQEVRNKVAEEFPVVGTSLGLLGRVDWALDLGLCAVGRVHKVEQLHEHHGLCLKSSLVVIVSDDEEHILEDCDEESLEESIGRSKVSLLGDVVNQLKTHAQASGFNISVIVLESPRTRVDDKLELVIVELEQGFGCVSIVNTTRSPQFLPGKQWRLMALNKLKNSTRCSGNSEKSLLIISKVHSNTFCMIVGTWSSIRA